MLTEEPDRKAKILLLAVKQPHVVLDNELLCYGFNGRHSAYFQYFPEELREDIESLTTGENSPLLWLRAMMMSGMIFQREDHLITNVSPPHIV